MKKILEKFGMHNTKPISTPLAGNFRLSSAQSLSIEAKENCMSIVPYSKCHRKLDVCHGLYPRHAYSTRLVNRFMANPRKSH